MKDRALIVFARFPKAGQVKTRLTTLISPQEAADLYRAFLIDGLKMYASLDVAVRLYMSDQTIPDFPVFGASIRHQHGSGLGPRMRNAFEETVTEGYSRAVLVGTDHPTLPEAFIRDAFESLSDAPTVCIGPTDDGGFYLLGMSSFIHGLFKGMTYSRSDVYQRTLWRANRSGAKVIQLPRWYDIDTPDDLKRLVKVKSTLPENTSRVMTQLKLTYTLD